VSTRSLLNTCLTFVCSAVCHGRGRTPPHMLYASDATLPKIDGRTPAFPKIGRRTPAIPKIDRRTPPPRTLAKQIRRSALSSSSSIPSLTPFPDELHGHLRWRPKVGRTCPPRASRIGIERRSTRVESIGGAARTAVQDSLVEQLRPRGEPPDGLISAGLTIDGPGLGRFLPILDFPPSPAISGSSHPCRHTRPEHSRPGRSYHGPPRESWRG
jgi:hypothetical protein